MNRNQKIPIDTFISYVESVLELKYNNDIACEGEHQNLIKMLKIILLTPCAVNIDYCDVKQFAEHNHHITYGSAVNQGEHALINATNTALDLVLKKNEMASSMIVHIVIPTKYSIESLSLVSNEINKRLQKGGYIAYQIETSFSLKDNEVTVHIVCAHNNEDQKQGDQMKSILNHTLISQNYFYPEYSYLENPYIIKSHGEKLACYYFSVPNAKKTIIHFHGNGEGVSDYIYSPLRLLGCNVLFAEYRGYGTSTGEPALVDLLDDVGPIIESLHLPMNNIILFGRSVGSIFAIEGAQLFPDISGLIIESGIANVVERVLMRVHPEDVNATLEEFLAEDKKYFDHKSKLENFEGTTLILHTMNDSLVSSSNAQKIYEWSNEPKELKMFIRGDHNNILFVNKEEYVDLVKAFIESLD